MLTKFNPLNLDLLNDLSTIKPSNLWLDMYVVRNFRYKIEQPVHTMYLCMCIVFTWILIFCRIIQEYNYQATRAVSEDRGDPAGDGNAGGNENGRRER